MQTKVTWTQGPFSVEVTSNQGVGLIAGRVKAQAEALMAAMPPDPVVVSIPTPGPSSKRLDVQDLYSWISLQEIAPSITKTVREYPGKAKKTALTRLLSDGQLVSALVSYHDGARERTYNGLFVPGTEPTADDDDQAVRYVIAQPKVMGKTGIIRSAGIPKERAKAALERMIESGEVEMRPHKLDSGLEYSGAFFSEEYCNREYEYYLAGQAHESKE